MQTEESALLAEIERFLRASRMTASTFGREVMGDPTFVFELREGRESRRATRERARAFMKREKTKPKAAA